MKISVAVICVWLCLALPNSAFAWGDDGHKTVALIAQQCLTSTTKKTVDAMLAADSDSLTPHDFASEATWADKYRDENNRHDHYQETQNWHFTDIEIDSPDLTTACFGRPPLPSNTLASNGPPTACAVDKVKQFGAELADRATDTEERLMALKFVLHFVGDLHQPLHSSDHKDYGGNQIKVTVDGFTHTKKDELHGFWDNQFVDAIAKPPTTLAKELLAEVTPAQAAAWAQGTPDDWAMEAFQLGKDDAYGNPPLSKATPQHIDAAYVTKAEQDVRLQLKRAGIRLAFLLNDKLDTQGADWAACLKPASSATAKASSPHQRRRRAN
jgi:hypothetical protein